MYAAKRPLLHSALFFLIIITLILAACSAPPVNWPGLSTDGEKLYLAYGPGVAAYDIETRQQIWSFPAEKSSTLLFYAPPSIQEDRLIIGDYGASGGFFSPGVVVSIYALNADGQGTPTTLWTKEDIVHDHIVASPLQVEDRVFVGTADNFVHALDAETGELLWSFETGHSVWGQPVYKDGVLFVASLDKSLHALDANSGEELWVNELGGALPGHPVIDDTLLYVGGFDSQVHAIDIETGETQWSAPAQDWVWGAPTLTENALYYTDIQGNVYAANSQDGSTLWTQKIEGVVQTSPVVAGDTVFIASQGAPESEQGLLVALSVEDGRILWQQNTPTPLFTTPVVVENSVIVVTQSEDALLIAYDVANGTQQWVIAPPAE